MNNEAGTELRFKPSSFGRHDVAAVGNVDELAHCYRIKSQSHLHFAAVNPSLEFAETSDSAYEVDSLIAAKVSYSKNIAKDKVRRNSHVKNANRVVVIISAGVGCERIPLATHIEGKIVEGCRLVDFLSLIHI